jgi:hypothetical protein
LRLIWLIAQHCRSSFVEIAFFLLCDAVMVVLFVQDAGCLSLVPFIACTSSDCAEFIINSVHGGLKYYGKRLIFQVSICKFPGCSAARTNRGFWSFWS